MQHTGPARKEQDTPDITQVLQGARVAIVLKQDQPTGRESQGIVQDILTRGNHPRGIKVRLTDGSVGRVQRMTSEITTTSKPADPFRATIGRTPSVDALPERTLADFFPSDQPVSPDSQPDSRQITDFTPLNMSDSNMVKCPICDTFEGDEFAVSHHVDEHLT